MACITLDTKAVEKSTYIVSFAFLDENGDAVTPKTFAWKLSDVNGTIIRQATEAMMDTTIDVVLSGTDLAYDERNTKRLIAGFATYDSTEHGNDLPLNVEAEFEICPIENI